MVPKILSSGVKKLRSSGAAVLSSGSGPDRSFERPKLSANRESSVRGLFVIGDLGGASVIKLAMADGVAVVEHLVKLLGAAKQQGSDGVYDIIVVGAGAAGLNAALAAQDKGYSCLVLEKGKIANTIEMFPEGKWVYAEPDSHPAKGKLWLDGASKEELLGRWHEIIADNKLDIKTEEALVSLTKDPSEVFKLTTDKDSYRSRFVVLASGQRGTPRRLGVPGEDLPMVAHKLFSPKLYAGRKVVVVGGGNSAVEAALTLCESSLVTIIHRGTEFVRLFADNKSQLDKAVQEGRIKLILQATVEKIEATKVSVTTLDGTVALSCENVFVLVGASLPSAFLKSLGIQLENEWNGSPFAGVPALIAALLSAYIFSGRFTGVGLLGFLGVLAALISLMVQGRRGNRYSWLYLSFLVWYGVYGIKVGKNEEFWPFRGWGYSLLSFAGRPWSFWYTVGYTGLMTFFGLAALKRWGIDKKDRFQVWRFSSLIGFQWVFFFIIPEFLFQYAVKYQFVGEALAKNPSFAGEAWRSYGIIYAWPLFFYTFFYNPHQLWVVWGVALTFLFIPILVLFHGKRYCSWICGCGGLAETFGDRWRHLAPKGLKSIELERMGTFVLIAAVGVTFAMIIKDTVGFFRYPAERGVWLYRIIVDVWLVGILPVTLYPFLGGKVWCRYWCPLAKLMQFESAWFSRKGWGRFKIEANEKCIACGECSRYCQVGIDVMSYALKQQTLDNVTSSCIGCGICVTACPMETLSFGSDNNKSERLKVLAN
jgi:NosR/NirI family transcriptional regulator, nitrous oxide reductase regulator